MYVAEKLVFVELHKTGGSHIGKWLTRIVPGTQVGKHNRVPAELCDRFIVGSVRNPWDWYVSLWAYGCKQQGSVYRQTTGGLNVGYLRRQLGSEMGSRSASVPNILRQATADLGKQSSAWRAVYRDSSDATAFRQWLGMMMHPRHRFDMAEGYGFSPASSWAGLLSYRYLKLFTKLGGRLYSDRSLDSAEKTAALLQRERIVSYVVRNEHLEADLIEAITRAGYAISPSDREALIAASAAKTNASVRMETAHYYDDETLALIERREQLIISEHGYSAPTLRP